jgi:hypothetical protein
MTFEHLRLQAQQVFGLVVYGNTASVHRPTRANTVPAARLKGRECGRCVSRMRSPTRNRSRATGRPGASPHPRGSTSSSGMPAAAGVGADGAQPR